MGFRLRKPRPLIAHADKEQQSAYKKFRQLAKNPSVDLVVDEVHFQQHGSRGLMWGA
jgi:hypothetical protein